MLSKIHYHIFLNNKVYTELCTNLFAVLQLVSNIHSVELV